MLVISQYILAITLFLGLVNNALVLAGEFANFNLSNDASKDLNNQDSPIEAEIAAREALDKADALVTKHMGKKLIKIAQAQLSLGQALLLQGRFYEAEPLLRGALNNAEQSAGPSSRLAINIQLQLGQSIVGQGRYADADLLLRSALARANYSEDVDDQAVWLAARNQMGNLQTLTGNYDEAESLLNAAFKLSNANENKKVQRIHLKAAFLLARLLQLQGKTQDAEKYARIASDLAANNDSTSPSDAIEAYTMLARVLLGTNSKSQEAEDWLLKAKKLATSITREETGNASKPFLLLGMLQDQRNNAAQAEVMYAKATELADQGAPTELQLNVLHQYAHLLTNQNRVQEAQPLYDRAIRLADRLFALSRGLDTATRENKVAILRPIYSEAIGSRVRLDQLEPGKGHDREALADVSRTQSRLFTELMRVADVTQLANNADFQKVRKQRDEQLHRLDQLQRRFTLIAHQDKVSLTVQPTKPIDDPFILARWQSAVHNLQQTISEATALRDEAEAQLWGKYPRFMELEDLHPVTVTELQQKWLHPNETLLTYYRLKNQLLIFLLSQDDFQLIRVPVEINALDDLVWKARKPMESHGQVEGLARLDPAVLNQLYNLLLKPVETSLPRGRHVLVVGDGPLYTLPMEMLVRHWNDQDRNAFNANRKGDLSEYGRLDYADAQWHFSYLPSLAALAIQRSENHDHASFAEDLIAYADPVFETADEKPSQVTRALLQSPGTTREAVVSIPRLPETADEVKAVAEILGGKHEIYLRDEAQEWRVKHSDLSQARYLEFATHGLLAGEFAMLKAYESGTSREKGSGTRNLEVIESSDDLPMKLPSPISSSAQGQPALVLSLVGDLHGEDGLLTMGEVMDLKMNADLVVLSACNTAGENPESRNGEGFAGLTRAFMYSGAKGLLVSHWSVESLATRDLIADFFRNLKSGIDTVDALAIAHEDLRNSRDERTQLSRSHPFFWAPFVYVGN